MCMAVDIHKAKIIKITWCEFVDKVFVRN